MGTGMKIALTLVLVAGLGVGGYFAYEAVYATKKPEGDKGGAGGAGGTGAAGAGAGGTDSSKGAPASTDKPAPITQGGGKESHTPTKTSPTDSILKKGSGSGALAFQNAEVKTLQTDLNTYFKAGLKVDGQFGSKTESALSSALGTTTINVSTVHNPATWSGAASAAASKFSSTPSADLADNGKVYRKGSGGRGKHFYGVKVR